MEPGAGKLGRMGFAVVLIVGVAALVSLAGVSMVGGVSRPMTAPSGLATALSSCNLVVNSENIANNAIQSAINSASPGWTVCVGVGSFPEQLTISTSGLTLRGAGSSNTILDPTSAAATTFDYDSATSFGNYASLFPAAAVILVDNTTGVTISSLGVSGASVASSSFTLGCAEGYFGVDFQNSSGTLTHSAVRSVAFPAALQGCQDLSAVNVYDGYFFTGFVPASPVRVTVSHTTVTGYDKNGITCDDFGELCTISENHVTGSGPNETTAQNGIQIGFGALGHVSGNTVSLNLYDGVSATDSWYANGFQASGILLYLQNNASTVSHNTLVDDALGIVSYLANAKITGNSVLSSASYGIVANGVPSTTVTISGNTVNNSGTGAPGILVDNGTFTLSNNHVSYTSAAGTNGPSQEVCGPNANTGIGTPLLSCGAFSNVTTAAIQAVSEGGPTQLTLSGNNFKADNLDLAVLAVFGGAVTLDFD